MRPKMKDRYVEENYEYEDDYESDEYQDDYETDEYQDEDDYGRDEDLDVLY